MGGQSTAVSATTESVFLESAFFAPSAIIGRARRIGLHTDASLRFERGVDSAGQARALERATELLLSICGGQAGPVSQVERSSDLPQRPAVALRRERLRAVLGVEVPADEVAGIFTRLEMQVASRPDGWLVTPPTFRFDIAIEEDLIEEVGRMFGYDAIPATPGQVTERLGLADESAVEADRVADLLAARGYAETITYSFIDPALEELANPCRRAGRSLPCMPGWPSPNRSPRPRILPPPSATCWPTSAPDWPQPARARGGWNWCSTGSTAPAPAPPSAPAGRPASLTIWSACSAKSWKGSIPASASR
jgi:phenylalanyl-tRNA synthetase beta subunit